MNPALMGCCFGAGPNTSRDQSLQTVGGGGRSSGSGNIILNHDFSGGLEHWYLNCCEGYVAASESEYPKKISAPTQSGAGAPFAVITNRNEVWQGFEQDITERVRSELTYQVSARVAVSGSIQGCTVVQALLKLISASKADVHYVLIARIFMPEPDRWERLEGTFFIPFLADSIKFYFEADPPGLDILIESVTMTPCMSPTLTSGPPGADIVLNPLFEHGLDHWAGRDCMLSRHSSLGEANRKVLPLVGNFFTHASLRSSNSNGIQQEITGRVQRKLAYEVIAITRILGNQVLAASNVKVTLWIFEKDLRERHVEIIESHVTDEDWVEMQGRFLLNSEPSRVIVYIHGPPPATDILVNSLLIRHAQKAPVSPKPDKPSSFGKNIFMNSSLIDGMGGWFPQGNCTLSVGTGAPLVTPPMAKISIGRHEFLSGHCIRVTNRVESLAGPAQTITEKLELYAVYQVSAWVRVAPGKNLPARCITIKVLVDDTCFDVCSIEVDDEEWHEIGGSFRIEKQPSVAAVHVGGPTPSVDLMIAGFAIFPVDRQARFERLRKQTEKIRQRDIILKFTGYEDSAIDTSVKVKQISNSFPLGSCINRTDIDNEDLVKFFLENFNWAVFGNELKWSSRINLTVFPYQLKWGTAEAKRGRLYFEFEDADELMEWCNTHGIKTRGCSIFWEPEEDNYPWIKELKKDDLMTYTQNRLNGLLAHFKGKFDHYDVNNGMLHGSFYKDRLGKVVWSSMFKTAHQLDPSASLFVNEAHVKDGRDTRSSPERYIQLVKELQKEGAQVGGIGVKGHISSPVGSIVCTALDKLSMLGLPIWLTELDVSSSNEHVRADDLEVMLREAFAHPAVEGIILWGFWELGMDRRDAHLVDAEGEINEAGKRFLSLRKEWLTETSGSVDQDGEFRFRGFHGTYQIEVVRGSKTVVKTLVVEKGELPLVSSIKLS